MVDEITKGVVPNNDIPVASAASGVVAININGLLAQRAGDLFFQQWKSEAISNGSAENSASEGCHVHLPPMELQ